MHLRSVRAHAFGAIADDTIEFGPGLTVVHGPNESGKTTWHAASALAIGGRRKGRAVKTDRAFDDQYTPWHHKSYAVSALVELADGRRVRLVRDLGRGVAQAIDDVTGADISADFGTDGTIDLATVIGLDRDTLPLVSVVRQSDIMALLTPDDEKAVGSLKGFLQQSASTRAESDGTAQDAIARLDKFAAERVGSDRAHTKPLRRALKAVADAESARDLARTRWSDLATLDERERHVAAQIEVTASRLRWFRLAELEASRDNAQQRLDAVRDAAAAVASEPALPDGADRVDEIRALLARLDGRPVIDAHDPHELPSLRAELEALPRSDGGPLQVPAELTLAGNVLRDAVAAVRAAGHAEPPLLPDPLAQSDLSATEVRALLDDLQAPVQPIDADLLARRDALSAGPSSAPGWTWVVAGVVAVVAAVLVASDQVLAGLLLAAAAIAGFVGWSRERAGTQNERESEITAINERIAAAEAQRTVADAQRREHRTQLVHAGVLSEVSTSPITASESIHIRGVIDAHERARVAAQHHASWQRTLAGLRRDTDDAAASLVDIWQQVLPSERAPQSATDPAPSNPTAGDPTTLLGALDRLTTACASRRADAREADRRPAIERQIVLATQRARSHERLLAEHTALDDQLADAAAVVGARGLDPDAVVTALQSWVRDVDQAARAQSQFAAAKSRRDTLLGGHQIDDFEAQVDDLATQVADAAAACTGRRPEGLTANPALIAKAQDALNNYRAQRGELHGQLTAARSTIGDLAALDEEVARAHAEVARLQRLSALVGSTRHHLEQARSAVHRDIAPRLADATSERLARVTAGRYKELRVDPDDLAVTVMVDDGTWRPAAHLSHGTREQIHLLLRAAIAEAVAPDAESCPLLLDDITVHADLDRTNALLDVVADLAEDRQVVLFTQERDVVSWASTNGAAMVELPAR